MKKRREGKIKVVIGANDLLLAGVQRLVIDQLQLLDRSRFDIHLIVLMQFEGKETFNHLIPSDISVHQLSFSGFTDLKEWKKVFNILKSIRPDVVKTATFFSNTIFLLFKPFFRYEVIAAEHNTVSVKPFPQRVVDWLLLSRAYKIVGDSQMVVDFVSEAEHINKKKFAVIYNGVDLKNIAKSKDLYGSQKVKIRAEYNIPSDAHVIFSAARLVKQKNHTLMIEGLAKLRESNDDVYLVLAGGGGLLDELKSLAEKLGVSDRVVFLGEQKEVHRFYSIADIFLVTSTREGFCIAAMEGLAFGMPLISTRVAGILEYLKDGENGFFVDYNADDVSKKLLKVVMFSEEERAQFSVAGRNTAQEYSTERYGREINTLFEKAVS